MAAISKSFKLCQTFRNFSTVTKDTVYFEYIPDIRALDVYNRDLVLHSTYTIFLTSLRAFTFEQYVDLALDSKKVSSSYVLLKERRFNSVIGYSFHPIHEFYYKDNDKSEQNKYITSLYYTIAVNPNFRAKFLGRTLFEVSELLLKNRFKDSNRISFNTTMNPIMYEQRSKLTPFIVPGPRAVPNEHPMKMMNKLIKELGHTPYSEERPYVKVYPGASVPGNDAKESLKNVGKVSEMQRFIIEQINGNDDWAVFNLALFNLIKGNTAEIAPGEYFAHNPVDYDVFDYVTKRPIKI